MVPRLLSVVDLLSRGRLRYKENRQNPRREKGCREAGSEVFHKATDFGVICCQIGWGAQKGSRREYFGEFGVERIGGLDLAAKAREVAAAGGGATEVELPREPAVGGLGVVF